MLGACRVVYFTSNVCVNGGTCAVLSPTSCLRAQLTGFRLKLFSIYLSINPYRLILFYICVAIRLECKHIVL